MEKERVRETTERGRRERTTGESGREAERVGDGQLTVKGVERVRKKKRREGRGTTTPSMPS